MGHQFGALDEYEPPYPGYPSTGGLFAGYLGVKNRNAVRGGVTEHLCLMRGVSRDAGRLPLRVPVPLHHRSGGLSRDQRRRAPGRDRHAAGVHVRCARGRRRRDGDRRTVTEQPWPHGVSTVGPLFTKDVSIFVPHDVQYRVDGGEWLPVTALDGAFDEPSEKWALTTVPLAQGPHVLEVQGTTGLTAGLTLQVTAAP